jgi:hypothetical protein
MNLIGVEADRHVVDRLALVCHPATQPGELAFFPLRHSEAVREYRRRCNDGSQGTNPDSL